MAKPKPLTLSDFSQFLGRLRVTIEDAERYHQVAGALGKLLPQARVSTSRAAAATTRRPARKKKRHSAKNAALESQIIALVKSTKGGMGSAELADKSGAPKDRVKAIAHKLKAKGVFKVVGVKRSAKYQLAG